MSRQISKRQVCVVVPIYKEQPNKFERLSIELVEQKLSRYPIYFITYKAFAMQAYQEHKSIQVKFFPQKYFKNTFSYSRLLLNPNFYKCFAEYKYMLIVQTDALILGDFRQLEQFMAMNYDYWGARWKEPIEICAFDIMEKKKKALMQKSPKIVQRFLNINPRHCSVGNGGLSLRNINKTIALLKEMRINAFFWFDNEDKFFAYYGIKNHVGYRIAPAKLVDAFSLEGMIKQKLGEVEPFGVHGWEKAGRLKVTDYLRSHGIFYQDINRLGE